MSATIEAHPARGRGAWPINGVGGTLDVAGIKPGGFYVKNVPPVAMVGLKGFLAERASTAISVNDYAPYVATKGLQEHLGLAADGLFGSDTKAAVLAFQKQQGLVADGVYGPRTARVLWEPVVDNAIGEHDTLHGGTVLTMARGTISIESGWDLGAVGVGTPDDVGLGQISGVNHPDLTVRERFDPAVAIPYIVALVDYNLVAMGLNMRDGIAAYNLGVGGSRQWVAAGRPDKFPRQVNGKTVLVDVKGYIDKIIAAA